MSTDATSVRYSRQRVLAGFGLIRQQQLAKSRVLVIGAGGLGSAVLPMLASSGIGSITVVDDDVVDESNLHRQTLFTLADVGRRKADAATEVLKRLSPDAEVTARATRFTAESASRLSQDTDLIIDASDTIATRYLANDIAADRQIPLVWGNALGWAGQVGAAWNARGVDYRDLFPSESTEDSATCTLVGVLPTVCAVIGGIMANDAIKLLTDTGEPLLGRVLHFDARTGSFRELSYRRNSDTRRASTATVTTEPESIGPALLQSILDEEEATVLVDVREPWEAELRHIPGSILIPLGELTSRYSELNPSAATIVYCQHGVRSAQAADYMQQIGFSNVRHLAGGIESWLELRRAITLEQS